MRHIGLLIVTAGALAVAGYAVAAYTLRPLGTSVHPDMRRSFEAHRVAITAHIFGSAVALLLGPWQFFPGSRAALPGLHRLLGKLYLLVGVLVGGLAGLWVSPFAFGGTVSALGFGLLAVLWLLTGALMFRTAHRRDFVAHRRWAVRNFALTFAAVTLRIGLGLGFAAGLPFETFYPPLAWLCWVPNLLIAERLLRETAAPVEPGPRAV